MTNTTPTLDLASRATHPLPGGDAVGQYLAQITPKDLLRFKHRLLDNETPFALWAH